MDMSATTQKIVEILLALVFAGSAWYLKALGTRVDKVEEDLKAYETDVGVGHAKLESLHELIQGHMDREEEQLKMLNSQFHDLSVQLATLMAKLEAVAMAATTEYARIARHESDSEDWKLRIVRLETRLEKVEKNGSK